MNTSKDCDPENNDSLVVLVKHRQRTILITGDAEWDPDSKCVAAIPRMLERFKNSKLLNIDIYKVGHHDSHNGTNIDYLKKMTPRISVISAGSKTDAKGRDFGHPRQKTVNELTDNTANTRPLKKGFIRTRAEGAAVDINVTKAIYCTCRDGDIVIPIRANGVIVAVRTSNN